MFGIYKKPTERIFYPTVWMWEISLDAFHKYVVKTNVLYIRIQKSIVLLKYTSMCIQPTRRAHFMCGGNNRANPCRHHT